MIDIEQLRTKTWAIERARYTSANSYMVPEARPTRWSFAKGIKFFEGRPVGNLHDFNGDKITVDELRDVYRVWRPEETLEAAKVLKQHGRLLVVGRPQSGKGTILFGISDICDKQGIGYVMIDGHWLETPNTEVVSAINKANVEGRVIFFDSFDYLFAGSSKLRKLNKQSHAARTQEIIEALSKTTVPLVLTAHDEYWANLILDQGLIKKHADFLDTLGVYNLPRYIKSEESRMAFLIDHEYSLDQAVALLNIPSVDLIKDVVTKTIGNSHYIDELALALGDYGVLKKLARRGEGETFGLPDEVKLLLEKIKSGDEKAALDLLYIILGVHFESDFAATLRWQKQPPS